MCADCQDNLIFTNINLDIQKIKLYNIIYSAANIYVENQKVGINLAKAIKVTDDGLKKLQEELEYLKTEGRKDIAEKIKVARGYGDLSENSEYDDAKNEQAKIEARIVEIEAMLKNVEVIKDIKGAAKTVMVGVKVKVYDEEFDEEVEYHIVGSTEADPMNNKISDESPVGKALIGHKVNDTVIVEAPAGEIKLKIVGISK